MGKIPCILVFVLLINVNAFGKKRVEVYTDERIELLTVIQYLSGYPILNQSENLQYRKNIDYFFAGVKDHPAVILNRAVYPHFLNFDAAVTFIIHYDLPGFSIKSEFSQEELLMLHASNSRDTLRMLEKEFKDFYTKSNFKKFFLEHKQFYNRICRPIQEELNKHDVIQVMEEHYGEKRNSYSVILSPLLHDGGYEADVTTSKDIDMYAVIGPVYDSLAEIPSFDVNSILSDYVLHEFSHSFCNPLIKKYYEDLSGNECLMKPIRKSLKSQGYSTWQVALYEHLVRANEIILNEIIFGKAVSDSLYRQFVEKDHWIYLEGIVPIIRNSYLTNREQYKTQEAIMPEIIAYLTKQAKACK